MNSTSTEIANGSIEENLSERRSGSPLPGHQSFAAGRPVLLIDSACSRAFFVMAAAAVDLEFMRMVGRRSRGVLWVAANDQRLADLGLAPQHGEGGDHFAPIGLRAAMNEGVREYAVATLRALADPGAEPNDFFSPGHVFPTPAPSVGETPNTVAGAVFDLARMAGIEPVIAFLEAGSDRGETMSESEAVALSQELGLETIRTRDLALRRHRFQAVVEPVVKTSLPTEFGELTVGGYRGVRSRREYFTFTTEGVADDKTGIARVHIHRRCSVSDVFGGADCLCGEYLQSEIRDLHERKQGVIVYFGEAPFVGSCGALEGPIPESREGWEEIAEVGGILRDLGVAKVSVSSNAPLDKGVWNELDFVISPGP